MKKNVSKGWEGAAVRVVLPLVTTVVLMAPPPTLLMMARAPSHPLQQRQCAYVIECHFSTMHPALNPTFLVPVIRVFFDVRVKLQNPRHEYVIRKSYLVH